MGNAPSLYDNTDWNEANGGLTNAAETVDGAEPTGSHMIVTIAPQVARPGRQLPIVGNIVMSATREYQVSDADGTILYTTQKAEKLRQGFDLVDKDGKTLLRVDSSFNNREWHIYQVGTPVFEGQHPDPEPLEKCGEQLFRKASVFFGKDVEHMALVYMFRSETTEGDDDDVDAILKVERCSGDFSKWHFQSMLANPSDAQTQPLVGYWKWEGSKIPLTMDDKMTMDLAKGSDLGLHVILAVVATLERSSAKAEYTG